VIILKASALLSPVELVPGRDVYLCVAYLPRSDALNFAADEEESPRLVTGAPRKSLCRRGFRVHRHLVAEQERRREEAIG